MTFDHRLTQLRISELDHEIEQLRTERNVRAAEPQPGIVERARRSAGRRLIAAGEALGGGDAALRVGRA